jgi:PAS domain-containing protein
MDYILKDRMARLPSGLRRALEEKAAPDQRKQTKNALRQSEKRYRVVAETAIDSTITIGEGSSILFANNSAEKIFGYTVPELLGRELTSGRTLISSSLDSVILKKP